MTLRPATNLRRKVVKNGKNQDSIDLIINELERMLIRSRVPLSPLRFERGMLTALRGFLLRYASQASKLDDESLSLRNKKKEAKTVSFFVVCCGRFLCLLREIFLFVAGDFLFVAGERGAITCAALPWRRLVFRRR